MIKTKEAGATKQAPTPAQPAEEAATPSLKSPQNCAMCTPAGKICPSEYSIKVDWPGNSEDENESQEQNKDKDNFSDIEDWVADLEEQKNKDNKTPQPSPKPTSIDTIEPSKPQQTDLAIRSVCHQREKWKEETLEDIN